MPISCRLCFVFAVVIVLACGPTVTTTPPVYSYSTLSTCLSQCNGCCSSNGECYGGVQSDTCGTKGRVCTVCAASQTCDPTLKACVNVTSPVPSYSFCAPVSTSGARNHAAIRLASLGAKSCSGKITTSRNSQGNPIRIDCDGSNYSEDFTDTYSYNSKGRLIRFDHDEYSYAADFTETYSYDSRNLLTRFDADLYSYQDDVTNTFSYDARGLLTRFDHDEDSYGNDYTETFSYDASGRLTRWERDGSGSNQDGTLTVSYSNQEIRTDYNGASAWNGTVLSCLSN